MIYTGLLGLALLCGQTQPTLLRRLIPNPTGANGYEEYLVAAQFTSEPEFSAMVRWEPGALERGIAESSDALELEESPEEVRARQKRLQFLRTLEGKTKLEVQREFVRRYSRAWVLIQTGNLKPVKNPHTSITVETLFPELAAFKSLVRFGIVKASVELADGYGAAAVRTLTDAFRFTARTRPGGIIQLLVGTANQGMLNAALETMLSQLPERGLAGLENAIGELAPPEPDLLTGIAQERAFTEQVLRDFSKDPVEWWAVAYGIAGSVEEDPLPASDGIAEWLKTLPKDRWELVAAEVGEHANARYSDLLNLLRRPESEWVTFSAPEVPKNQYPAAIAETFVMMLDQVLPMEARGRAQARIAQASLAVARYRWHHGRLPAKLSDAVPAALLRDPLTGNEFSYEQSDGTFRVFSQGSKLGVVQLVMRRTATPALPVEP